MPTVRKQSRKRDAILSAICGTTSHPTAEWVYSQLKPEIPDLSLGTVYRNIALFREEGSVISVCTVDGQERYDGNTEEHAHFICESCGAVIDIACGADMVDRDTIMNGYGAEVSRSVLLIYGRCKNCK